MTVPYVGPCFVLGYSLKFPLTYPIGSMYGIYANIWGILMVNVTIYSSTMDPSWVCSISNQEDLIRALRPLSSPEKHRNQPLTIDRSDELTFQQYGKSNGSRKIVVNPIR